jgi:DNA-binding MarR family transcriptional regulator
VHKLSQVQHSREKANSVVSVALRPRPLEPKTSQEECIVFDTCCVAFNLRKTARAVSKIYDQEMRGAPIRGPLFSVLVIISKRRSASISGLANDIGLDRTTLTRNLKPLEKRGLIRIAPGTNRSKDVTLLPKGEAALQESMAYWRKAQEKVVQALGEDRWQRMRHDLSAAMAISPSATGPTN